EQIASRWLPDLARRAGRDTQRSFVVIAPLTLSRTQHDIGRTHPWTVYGGAELDWEELFWAHAVPPLAADRLLCSLLRRAVDESIADPCDLKELGVRLYARQESHVPPALRSLVLPKEPQASDLAGLAYLVTFVPRDRWPEPLRARYDERGFEAVPHPAT